MKKVWKWVIGIVLGLFVLAVLVGVGFMAFRGFHAVRVQDGYTRGWSQQGPGRMPNDGFGLPMRGPGMMDRGGMMPFLGFIGGLVCLGILVLIGLGIIWLVRATHKSARVESPATSMDPAEMPAPTMDTCKKCGKPIQAEWNNCPYCGKKV